MENITLEQIGIAVAFVVGLATGIGYLHKMIKGLLATSFKDEIKVLENKIDKFGDQLGEVDMATCKNFLVARISEVERGIPLNDVEEERFWEQYQHYRSIGGNTYIQRKVEQLKAEGKI